VASRRARRGCHRRRHDMGHLMTDERHVHTGGLFWTSGGLILARGIGYIVADSF
jgi:hypothetical protein